MALHVYPDGQKGELACLYVSASHENQGIGRKLIQFVESQARELGLAELYRALHAGVHLLSVEGRLLRGHAGLIFRQRRREKYDAAAATRRCWSRS